MRLTLLLTASALFATSAQAQTLSRDYRLPFTATDVSTGTTAASASAGSFDDPLPSVVEGPLGVGPLPNLCLRGTRTSQEIKFSEGVGAAGEAVFDIDLIAFAPGESFAIQVGHRDLPGGANTSNMLVGTAQ